MATKLKVPRFYVRHAEGNGYLVRFTLGYFTDGQDDPSCWTDGADRAQAKTFTQAQIDKMLPYILAFQGQPTIEPAA